jgi:DNA gyrase subunit A
VEIVGTAIVPMEPAGDDKADWDGPTVSRPDETGKIPDLLTITDKGYGKRTSVDEYRVTSEDGGQWSQSRGGKGRMDLRLSAKNGTPVAAFAVSETDDVVVISRMGQLVRVPASSISRYGRGTQGVRVVGLKSGDAVISATRVVESDDEEGPGAPPTETGLEAAPDSAPETGPEAGAGE